MIVFGYIDESYSSEPDPLTFNLSCLFTVGGEWFYFENAWQKVIDKKNAELTRAGRKRISDFHARNLNGFQGEFAGWDADERTAFTEQLILVFARHKLNSIGWAVNLEELRQEWPEPTGDTKTWAYNVLLRLIMAELAREIPGLYGADSRIKLIHDRSRYDGTLLTAFNWQLRQHPEHADLFTTISPMSAQHSTALQAADFIANESMKDVYRGVPGQKPRDRRKSLKAFLSLHGGGAKLSVLTKDGITDLRKLAEEKRLAGKEGTANGG